MFPNTQRHAQSTPISRSAPPPQGGAASVTNARAPAQDCLAPTSPRVPQPSPRHPSQAAPLPPEAPQPALTRLQSACIDERIASLSGLDAELEPWVAGALAESIGANIGIMHHQGDGSYVAEVVPAAAAHTTWLTEDTGRWGVWMPFGQSTATETAVWQQGQRLQLPLRGPDGFLFAAACTINYAGSADALIYSATDPTQFAQSLTRASVMHHYMPAAAPTLTKFAQAVALSLRSELQATLRQDPARLQRALWATLEELTLRADGHVAKAAQPGQSEDAVAAARAEAYCVASQAATYAPVFGAEITRRVTAQQNAVEDTLW